MRGADFIVFEIVKNRNIRNSMRVYFFEFFEIFLVENSLQGFFAIKDFFFEPSPPHNS